MRYLLYFFAVLFILYLLVLVFIFLSIRRNMKWFKTPSEEGKFVDAHGKKLYYRIKGKGEPVVAVFNAIGSAQAEWWPIQNEVGQKFRVITWDRAGYGWSTPDDSPRTALAVSDELDRILKLEKVKKPILLVAHGTGAVYARYYAAAHPENVSGLLLVDPLPVRYAYWLETINSIEECPNIFEAALKKKKLAGRGYFRIFSPMKGYKLDSRYQRDIIEHYSRTENYTAMQLEFSELLNSLKEIEAAGSLPSVPVKVLYPSDETLIRDWIRSGIPEYSARQLGRLHHELSGDMANLTPQTQVLEIEGSGEFIHLSQPDVVVREILDMLE